MDRKLCADCGQPNLDSEAKCWACGSAHFAPPGAKTSGDRTLAFGYAAGEQTVAWDDVGISRGRPAWLMPAAISVMTVLACLGGYAVGRVNQVSRPVPASAGTQLSGIPLPSPGRSVPPFPGAPDDPLVTVRSREFLPPPASVVAPPRAPAPAPPTAGTPLAPPNAVMYPGTSRSSGALATTPRAMEPSAALATPPMPRIRVTVPPPSSSAISGRSVAAPSRPSAPQEESPLPAPPREQSVIALRNDSPNSVEVTVEGNGSRTAYIPAGSTLPLRLEPGNYQLKASSGGASSAQSSLSLKRNRTYTMLVNRQTENGKDFLVLIEPLEPSFDE